MTDDITIPPEALEAAYNARRNGDTLEDICLAMLKAWPGMRDTSTEGGEPHWQHHLILPLPQEGAADGQGTGC